MFIPPNYEKVKASGHLKTILVYNGLGPWNVKQGKICAGFFVGVKWSVKLVLVLLCIQQAVIIF